ncbi:MAG: carboxypeptidase regulatory-like domain-containing protein [Acidobacteria bacterium]|nr:carboxypeptidase regulatory-like domain-containing protein [Acidobacteriota bacterium]
MPLKKGWVLLLGVFLTVPAFSQSVTGTITGVVKDPNAALVPNAVVVAKNTATGAEDATATNAEGFYRLANLVPGEYVVSVESKGFKKTTLSAQRLSVNDSLRLDVTLELGQVTEIVSVEATATEVGTEDAQLGKVLRDPNGLPVLSGAGGRNVLTLAGTQPGVVFAGQVGTFSTNGQRAQSNNYMFDGGDSNDLAINVPDAVNVISPNALQEFRLVTGAMKAEYGRNSGAIVQVVSRSGGNSWHGGATEIFRNTKLNAVPFFQKSTPGGTPEKFANGLPRKPQWNSNDFDAQFGGPVKRDKTFFFLSYLGFRRRQGVPNSATVFSDAQRAAIQAEGTPEAKALLALVPPASAINTLFSSPSNSLTRDQGLAKFDHTFSSANRFSATYFIENQEFADPFAFGSGSVPGFGTVGKLKFQNLVLRDTHVFSPNLFNEFRASYHRRGTLSVIPVNRTKLSSLGLGKVIPDDPDAEGPPRVDISGFTTFGNTIQGPQGRYDNTFQYIDNMSWTRGKHILKFGGEFRTYSQNQVFDFINNGYYVFDGSGTQQGLVAKKIPGLSDPLNDFANGFATQFVQNSAGRRGYRTNSPNLFVQDDWKVLSNFTVNLGLRWEYNSSLKDVFDRVNTLRLGQQSTVFPDAPTGLVYPGDTGITRSTYREDLNNFAPRVGFAWDVLKQGKLAVRGGYGLFYDAPISELTLQFLTSAPFAIQPFTLFTDVNNPWQGSRSNPIPQPFPFSPVPRGGRFDFTKIAPISLTVMDPNFATPYGQQWNLQVQTQPFRDWVLEAGYVGSSGVKLLNRRQSNPAIPGPGATTGNTNLRRVLNQNNPLNAKFGGAVFAGITNQLSDANSNYHSLQLGVTKRFSRGFQMSHAYTWGHAIDNASGLRVSSRIDNARADRGNSEQDIRHRYVGSYLWEAPWWKNQDRGLGRILGGWGVSGITTFQTGLVFNITEGTDRCLCTSGNQRPDYIGGNLTLFDPRSTSAVSGRANSYFDGTGGGTAAADTNPYFRRVGTGTSFALGAGRFGNMGRNVFHGPGLNNWEFSIFKRTKISESHKLEFRAEFFNMWNHTQFQNPDGGIASPNFWRVTTAQDPRLIQLGLRYMF